MAVEFNIVEEQEQKSLRSSPTGFKDPDNASPRAEYVNIPSTNKGALGAQNHKLYIKSSKNIDLGLETLPTSTYPLNQVRETVSGHVQELDDTPGRERILIKHKSGAGVEIRPDGTVVISARNNLIQIGDNDHKVIIERDGEVHYKGNYTMNVSGDYDLKVGGNYKLTVDGNRAEETRGYLQENVKKNKQTFITQNSAEYVNGTKTVTVLKDLNIFTKGNQTNFVEGTVRLNSKGSLEMTSEGHITRTADYIYDGAKTRANFIAPTGTMGGESFTMYTRNIFGTSGTFTEGFTAPTFHGSLQGNAATATQAGTAGTAGAIGASGSAGSHTNTATNTTETTKPTTTLMTDYASNSNLGIKDVQIDKSDIIKFKINNSEKTGGLTNRSITTANVRAILKDPNAMRNEKFIGSQISAGVLNANYINAVPKKIGRVSNLATNPEYGIEVLGNASDIRRFA